MEALLHLLVFAIVVAIVAIIVIYVAEAVLAALSLPSGPLVRLLIGVVALLIILSHAWPMISAYT